MAAGPIRTGRDFTKAKSLFCSTMTRWCMRKAMLLSSLTLAASAALGAQTAKGVAEAKANLDAQVDAQVAVLKCRREVEEKPSNTEDLEARLKKCGDIPQSLLFELHMLMPLQARYAQTRSSGGFPTSFKGAVQQLAPPSAAGIVLNVPQAPAAVRVIPGVKKKESGLQERNGLQPADKAGRRGIDRQIKAAGQTAEKFKERMEQGKLVDAPLSIQRDYAQRTSQNVAKTTGESPVINNVAHGVAGVVAPVIGPAILDANNSYQNNGRDPEKGLRDGGITAATGAAGSVVGQSTPDTLSGAVAEAAANGTIAAVATHASGGDHKDAKKAFETAAASSLASAGAQAMNGANASRNTDEAPSLQEREVRSRGVQPGTTTVYEPKSSGDKFASKDVYETGSDRSKFIGKEFAYPVRRHDDPLGIYQVGGDSRMRAPISDGPAADKRGGLFTSQRKFLERADVAQYGADGRRLHGSNDFLARPGEAVYAPMSGEVKSVGYYKGMRTVHIETEDGFHSKSLYVKNPKVAAGDVVKAGRDQIGSAGDLSKLPEYRDVPNHVHVTWSEGITRDGKSIRPFDPFSDARASSRAGESPLVMP